LQEGQQKPAWRILPAHASHYQFHGMGGGIALADAGAYGKIRPPME